MKNSLDYLSFQQTLYVLKHSDSTFPNLNSASSFSFPSFLPFSFTRVRIVDNILRTSLNPENRRVDIGQNIFLFSRNGEKRIETTDPIRAKARVKT